MSRPAAKLTPDQVVEIRELIATGACNEDLAPLYGVSPETIRKIRYGRTWRTLHENWRTHCGRGHAYAEHAYVDQAGRHCCRECRRQRERSTQRTREEYLAEHAGHELRTRSTGVVFCLSCWRGEHDIDQIAVERAVSGNPPACMSTAERGAAIDRLLAAGLSQLATARRLHISDRTVARRAAVLRQEAA
ncbi:hypothetical protein [Parafrankia sp. FMc2]|uniref:hypothetical protein n=1 Tax=Parafrankia sp. FMc2 TaxID=3233196 RepID=UPI0034D7AF58